MNFFEEAYSGIPPWDIGRPQPAFVELQEAGAIQGRVLDVGCGTGENAIYLVQRGHQVWGIDLAPKAIDKAREKARQRRVLVRFLVWDALELASLGEEFDSVIDSGLFHSLTDEERVRYEAGLRKVLRPGGSLFILCFSEHEPGSWGPRRVTQEEIRETFAHHWTVNEIREARMMTNLGAGGARAWLASLTLLGGGRHEQEE